MHKHRPIVLVGHQPKRSDVVIGIARAVALKAEAIACDAQRLGRPLHRSIRSRTGVVRAKVDDRLEVVFLMNVRQGRRRQTTGPVHLPILNHPEVPRHIVVAEPLPPDKRTQPDANRQQNDPGHKSNTRPCRGAGEVESGLGSSGEAGGMGGGGAGRSSVAAKAGRWASLVGLSVIIIANKGRAAYRQQIWPSIHSQSTPLNPLPGYPACPPKPHRPPRQAGGAKGAGRYRGTGGGGGGGGLGGVGGMGAAYPESVQRLISELAKLPGIGPRSAERLAFHVLKSTSEEAARLSRAIDDVKAHVGHCSICYNLADSDPCPLCSDHRRDRSRVLVVEQPKDLIALEQTGMYRGVYHVLLGRISPLDGVGPDDLTVAEPLARVRDPAKHSGGGPVKRSSWA